MKQSDPFHTSSCSNKLAAIGYVWIILLVTSGLSACHKGSPGTVTIYPCSMDSLTNNQTGPVDIYLAGWRSYYPSNEVAVYWKNGVLTDLTDGTRYITANSIAIAGKDVYVGGNAFINNHYVAKYWKNGMVANFLDTTMESYVNSAAASGEDIYFAGYVKVGLHKIAEYWKNGHAVMLTAGATDAEITSITVACNNVYAAGWESNGRFEVAKYWINGTGVNLSDGSKNTEALSIATSGKDIYVAGNEYTNNDSCPACGRPSFATVISKVWKNGTVIETGTTSQRFNAMAISNGDLYMAGNDGSAASYFKNGNAVHLTDGKSVGEASAIAIWKNDIYVTGYENILGHNVPTYWKNAVAVRLTNGLNNDYSLAIFLNKQQ
jgi:hypothetical protein